MLYQRRIADNQVLSAKLELHLRGSRYAGVGTQLLGIVSLGLAGFYSLDPEVMLTWATSLLLLNFWWSRRINRTLQTSRHFTQRPSVFNELIVHAAVSGATWGGTVIWLDGYLSDLIFYLCVCVVAVISVVTIAVSVVIRQAYLTQLIFSLGTADKQAKKTRTKGARATSETIRYLRLFGDVHLAKGNSVPAICFAQVERVI